MKQRFENLGLILIRDAQKKLVGGLEEEGSCTSQCTGDKWNGTLLIYERKTETCLSFMGSCGCPSFLYNATSCA